jgi:rhamnosyltransferase
MFLGNAISDSWHALGKGVLLKEMADIWQFRFMQFWGTFLGYRDGREIHKELRERFYYPNKLEKSAPTVDSRNELRIDYSTSE